MTYPGNNPGNYSNTIDCYTVFLFYLELPDNENKENNFFPEETAVTQQR